jgi:hypothetical protein
VKKKCLVLNQDRWSPVGLISWQRAVVLGIIHEESIMQGDGTLGLEVIDFYRSDEDFILATGGKKYPIPAVAASPTHIKQHNRKVPFSRKNVFLRDGMRCQYCGLYDPSCEKLTFDHVIPRKLWKSKESPTNWSNIVTACIACNRRKSDNSLAEARMSLKKQPKPPNPHHFILGMGPWTRIEKEWLPYIEHNPLYQHILKMRT